MLSRFLAKKSKIVQQLSAPLQGYTDASPKGSVDEGIRGLVEAINRNPDYVTTSSCAGRLSVFLEGAPKSKPSSGPVNPSLDQSKPAGSDVSLGSTGGKGGGRWLFVSHDPVDLSNFAAEGQLLAAFGLKPLNQSHSAEPPPDAQYIHLKFEPMILHILTSSLEDAQKVHTAAMTAGFRESGISGVVGSRGEPVTPMVAVRSAGLLLDCIIGFQNPLETVTGSNGPIAMVSEEYLRTLVRLSSQRFRVNEERKTRFQDAFEQSTQASLTDDAADYSRRDYEPAAVRKQRKRSEGLRVKEMLAAQRSSDESTTNSGVMDSEEDDLCGAIE